MNLNSQYFKQLFIDFKQKPIYLIFFLILIAAIIKLISLYTSVDMDSAEWEQYKQDHNCQMRTSTTEAKLSSWQCDNGEVFYNWRQQR